MEGAPPVGYGGASNHLRPGPMLVTPLLIAALGIAHAAAPTLPPSACADGRPCTLRVRHAAGTGASGAALEVWEVGHGEPVDRITDPARQCPQVTYWRVGGGLPSVRLLDLCNDGYGVSGVGEDRVTVAENSLTVSRVGGSAWRWSEGMRASLDPLALLAVSKGSFHAARPGVDSQSTVDLQAGTWSTTWSHPRCGTHTYNAIPVAEHAPPDDVPLGTCSARASADGETGFIVSGSPGVAADGRLAAVFAGPRTLVVDVWDDSVVAHAPSWVDADHLEVWTDSQPADRSMAGDCLGATDSVRQWGISWDGQVRPGVGGDASAPTARVTRHGSRHRVVVELPVDRPVRSVTVVFSDADDSARPRQDRLVATSPVSLTPPHLLGAPAPLLAVRCAVVSSVEGRSWDLVPDLAAWLEAGRGVDLR